MKDIVRTLDFYGFDGDNTLYDVNSYPVSKVVEVENNKYVNENNVEDASNDETEPTTEPTEP
jgi:hypothetical protein